MASICLKGDCLELMKDLSNNSIDLFICDLPYGCLGGKERDRSGEGDIGRKPKSQLGGCPWDIKIDLVEFWKQIKRLCKTERTPILMFCNTKFGVELINSNPSWFKYDLVWNKNMGVSFLLANKMPMKAHEMIYVFSKKSCNYNRIDEFVEDAKGYTRSAYSRKGNRVMNAIGRGEYVVKENLRCPISVVNFGRNQEKKHPTAKPVELYDWLIKRYSNEGDTILDPTAGSFNSGHSALGLKRNYIGMEMNDEFYDNNKI
jgi:site-specific DNA-methyltransferase (adenine-specific)